MSATEAAIRELRRLLSEGRCKFDDCQDGMRHVSEHNWFVTRPCDWCSARKAALSRNEVPPDSECPTANRGVNE